MSRSKKHAKTCHVDPWLNELIETYMEKHGLRSMQEFLEDAILLVVSGESSKAQRVLELKSEERRIRQELQGGMDIGHNTPTKKS